MGARAMHALQNYGEKDPIYDGNAYCYTARFHASEADLWLYAHHLTAPTTLGGKPGYHMRLCNLWGLHEYTGKAFRQGATAFRKARDAAKKHRDEFIRAANAKACHAGREPWEEPITTVEQVSELGCDEVMELDNSVESPAGCAGEQKRFQYSRDESTSLLAVAEDTNKVAV